MQNCEDLHRKSMDNTIDKRCVYNDWAESYDSYVKSLNYTGPREIANKLITYLENTNIKQNILDFHDAIKLNSPLPKCNNCGGVVKVATISFGQPMNEIDMMHASNIVENSDLMIVMGSSLKVLPAGKLPNLAMQTGSKLIILNRDKTRYDAKADIVINDELKNICGRLMQEL